MNLGTGFQLKYSVRNVDLNGYPTFSRHTFLTDLSDLFVDFYSLLLFVLLM